MATETAFQEIELVFGGANFRVRPEFKVVSSIEQALQQPCRTLGLKCYAAEQSQAWRTARGITSEISLTELAAICFYALRDQKGAPKDIEAAGEILMDYGYDDLLAPLADFLARAKRGHKDHEREAKLAAERAARAKESGDEEAEADPPNKKT